MNKQRTGFVEEGPDTGNEDEEVENWRRLVDKPEDSHD